MISAPERYGLDTGGVVSSPVCHEDIMPTVLEMAGVEVPDTVEGRSLLPIMRGEHPEWRDQLHIQHSPSHHALTDGTEKYIWWVKDGSEQLFNSDDDPHELHDLSEDPGSRDRLEAWRRRLIEKLKDRPEGFSDGETLISGQKFGPLLPTKKG
jgi:arylsulfatase A-like enzyme